MYCSECKLRVADDSVVICPVCQGALQSESEAEEKPESVDFVDELAAVFETDQDPDIKLEDKLDAYVRDDANLDFDPEVLGLKSSHEEDPAASADDIRVLADLWEKEDIGADLDGVFADAFNLEAIDSESSSEDPAAIKTEQAAPETPEKLTPEMSTPVMTTPEVLTPAPAGNSRNLVLPLLVFILCLIVGGGWFYMQNAGVKPENKLAQEIKSPVRVPAEPQIEPQSQPQIQSESSDVNNEPLEDKVVSVAEKSTVAAVKPLPAGGGTVETSESDNQGSVTDVTTAAAASPATGSSESKVTEDSKAITSDTMTQPAAESQLVTASAPASLVEKKTPPESVVAVTAAANQQRETVPAEEVVPESIPVQKEKVVTVSEKVNPAVVQGTAAAGPRYVVHIGSFRNEAGAARQLAFGSGYLFLVGI